jgi:hypothetical protein
MLHPNALFCPQTYPGCECEGCCAARRLGYTAPSPMPSAGSLAPAASPSSSPSTSSSTLSPGQSEPYHLHDVPCDCCGIAGGTWTQFAPDGTPGGCVMRHDRNDCANRLRAEVLRLRKLIEQLTVEARL